MAYNTMWFYVENSKAKSELYSKTNQMHNFSNLYYFGTTLYMFRMVSPSIIRSQRLYIQHQVYVVEVLWLLASKQPQNLYDIHLMLYVQSLTPDDGQRDRPKHVECSCLYHASVIIKHFIIQLMSYRFCGSLLASSHRTCTTYT